MRCSKTLAVLLCAAALSAPALAQDSTKQSDNVFTAIGRWFSDSFVSVSSRVKNAREEVGAFNREAGIAVRATGGAVKDAAGAVAKLPNTRVLAGHQKCAIAANGAPDCIEAANKLCKGGGFTAGQSVDITAAEECPLRVTLGHREAGPGECKSITYVSKAMCQ
jgi:hypothetical protein